MDIAWTVELAVHVSRRSDLVIEGLRELPDGALRDFWKYSRRRMIDWRLCRNRLHTELPTGDAIRREQLWQDLEALLSEFFVSDVLIRLWSAVLTAAGRRRGTNRAEPIARHVHLNHLQSRYLALKLLVDGRHLSRSRMARLNALRRTAERWTDLLLGRLICRYDVCDFAFDEAQAREFGEGQLAYPEAKISNTAWELILAGARLTFRQYRAHSPWRAACLRRIAASVLAAFPGDTLFASVGSTSLQRALFAERPAHNDDK